MRLTARPIAATALLVVTLVPLAGCVQNAGEGSTTEPPVSKQEPAQGPAAGQPEAAQRPRPNSEPLFHATNSTGGRFHELEISGGFTVRFACKGVGRATVSMDARTRYVFTCSQEAGEQRQELVVRDATQPHTYRIEVATTSAKNTWSLFLDRLL